MHVCVEKLALKYTKYSISKNNVENIVLIFTYNYEIYIDKYNKKIIDNMHSNLKKMSHN